MSNINKRILTSLIVFPLSMYFILMGGNFIVSFLYAILILANFEAFSVFKKKFTIIFLDSVLVVSLLSVLHLRNDTASSFILLIWIIILTICSDIGGYVFGKFFKWKNFTKISPKKTLSGVLGSFLLSISSVFIMQLTIQSDYIIKWLEPKFFFIAIILSLTAQAGDLTISYFKRKEKIKDTGKILPGHGGIFDRIDSLMFVIILGFLLYNYKIIP